MAWEQCCCSRPAQNATILRSQFLLATGTSVNRASFSFLSTQCKGQECVRLSHLLSPRRSSYSSNKNSWRCRGHWLGSDILCRFSSKSTPPEALEEKIEDCSPSPHRCNLYGDVERGWATFAVTGVLVLALAGGAQNAVAEGWFGGPSFQKDPVEPFTIYGSVFKKFLIEDIVDGKVVGRRKGFTATACVNCLEASRETPEMQAVPPGLKVSTVGEPSCSKGVGKSKEESCETPCRTACRNAIERHARLEAATTGYRLESTDEARAISSCSKQCYFECMKAGKSISFVIPFRP